MIRPGKPFNKKDIIDVDYVEVKGSEPKVNKDEIIELEAVEVPHKIPTAFRIIQVINDYGFGYGSATNFSF